MQLPIDKQVFSFFPFSPRIIVVGRGRGVRIKGKRDERKIVLTFNRGAIFNGATIIPHDVPMYNRWNVSQEREPANLFDKHPPKGVRYERVQ